MADVLTVDPTYWWVHKHSDTSWADCLSSSPTTEGLTWDHAAELFRAYDDVLVHWQVHRVAASVDVSAYHLLNSATLSIKVKTAPTGSFKIYAQAWDEVAYDWESTGSLTALSASITPVADEETLSITLINLSALLATSGKMIFIDDAESTEPTGYDTVLALQGTEGAYLCPTLTVDGAGFYTATGSITLPSLSVSGGSKQRHSATGSITLPAISASTKTGWTNDSFMNTPIPLSRVKGGRVSIQDITDGKVSIHES